MTTLHIQQNEQPLHCAVTLPRLMTQKDLAQYLGKSIAWCERARWAGDGPQFVKLGRNVRYKADDVIAWVNSNMRQSTSEQGGAL